MRRSRWSGVLRFEVEEVGVEKGVSKKRRRRRRSDCFLHSLSLSRALSNLHSPSTRRAAPAIAKCQRQLAELEHAAARHFLTKALRKKRFRTTARLIQSKLKGLSLFTLGQLSRAHACCCARERERKKRSVSLLLLLLLRLTKAHRAVKQPRVSEERERKRVKKTRGREKRKNHSRYLEKKNYFQTASLQACPRALTPTMRPSSA